MEMHLGKNWKQFPDAKELDAEFLYADAAWEDDNQPLTSHTMIALAEGARQQWLENTVAAVIDQRLISQIPILDASNYRFSASSDAASPSGGRRSACGGPRRRNESPDRVPAVRC
jgi:hypothetical protein